MKLATFKATAVALTLALSPGVVQAQEWEPNGPIRMLIGFQAGGATDTLGRLLAEELGSRYGWEVIPQNVVGRGGTAMAVALKDEPNDGHSIGVTATDAMTYGALATRNPGFAVNDFTYLSALVGSQMGIIAKTSRGWETLADVIEAARAGERITVGAISDWLADATYVLGINNGVEFTTVMVGGGRASVNAVIADDVDLAWAAGSQIAGVNTGDLTNLASAEAEPLQMQPDAPLLQDFDMPYIFNVKFMVIAPDGIPAEAQETWQHHIAEILSDPESPLTQFAYRTFTGPEIVQGDDLVAVVQARYEESEKLLEAASQ